MTGIRAGVERLLDATVSRVRPLDGGEIGEVARVELGDGRVVVAKTGPAPLDAEARALRRLSDAGLPTPAVLAADATLLVLEFVHAGAWSPGVAVDLGRRIARLHGRTRDAYGYPEPTWKGRLELPNEDVGHEATGSDWPAFFGENRLRPAARAARNAGGIDAPLHDRVNGLADALDSRLPASPPASLLHGDVWRNNVVPGDDAVRAVLDPAPWFGDPAFDVAYAEWCGLGDAFRRGYDSVASRSLDTDARRVYEVCFALDHAFHFPERGYDDGAAERLTALGY